jgi:hypothetical protein
MAGSSWRIDGGRACSRAGRSWFQAAGMLEHAPMPSGKHIREWARSWASVALDLTRMRIASRSRRAAKAWHAGLFGSCEAIKRLIAEMPSAGRRVRRKRRLSASESSETERCQSASSGMLRAATERTCRRPVSRQDARECLSASGVAGDERRMMEWATSSSYSWRPSCGVGER